MNKLMTSFICTTVLSMSLLGVGYASTATGTTGMDGTMRGRTGTNDGIGTMNFDGRTRTNGTTVPGTTVPGTMYRNDGYMNNNIGTRNDGRVTPLSNTTTNGNYRARSTTGTTNNGSNWGWLGLIGLLGLAGMRNKSGERH